MLTFSSQDGKRYTIEKNATLQGNWTEVSDGVESDGDTTTYTEKGVPLDSGELYYRVQEE